MHTAQLRPGAPGVAGAPLRRAPEPPDRRADRLAAHHQRDDPALESRPAAALLTAAQIKPIATKPMAQTARVCRVKPAPIVGAVKMSALPMIPLGTKAQARASAPLLCPALLLRLSVHCAQPVELFLNRTL